MRFGLETIPSGEAGTDRTVGRIMSLVDESLTSPIVRLQALSILKSDRHTQKGARAVARALYLWVRNNIRFIADPSDLETVQSPEVTLRLRAGDCDDHAGLMAALLKSVGIDVRFKVLGQDAEDFQHIYVEALVDGQWLPYDTTTKSAFMQPPTMPAQKVYPMQGEIAMINSLSANSSVLPVKVADVKRAAYTATIKALNSQWQNGLIDRSDLWGYLNVMDKGKSPSHGTIAEVPMSKAIEDFLKTVNEQRACSVKSSGQLSGLRGLWDSLQSVWEEVQQGVNSVVTWGEEILGSSAGVPAGQSYQITPTIQFQPSIPTQATTAGVQTLLTSPTFIGLVLIGLVLVVGTGQKGKRRKR